VSAAARAPAHQVVKHEVQTRAELTLAPAELTGDVGFTPTLYA
jgi:hypothetical protein